VSVAEAAAALDLSVLLGDWRNTNPAAGIARIIIEPNGDGRVRVHCSSGVRDWGTVVAPVFAFDFDGDTAGAFFAVYDFDFAQVRVQGNVKQGVLVVATFNAFKDDSGRSNYFNREFFYR
jgi:hypothetical protein